VGGVKPNLFAAGIGRPFTLSDQWRLGLRGYGQFGTIKGDITCDADTVAAGLDPERNPFLCEEVRPPATSTQNDGLLNLRVLFAYQIR
jgi:hypothetical protein